MIIYGILFNDVPNKVIDKLGELKILYQQMDKFTNDKSFVANDKKMQTLFSIIEGRQVNFKELIEKVDEITARIDQDDKKNSYKLFGFVPCEKSSITGVFTPLAAVLWTAIIHSITLLRDLFSRSYV
jgi:hypothetical protein